MRGGSVIGAAIVDSHNRWITIHGTEYLVVRDCVGYQSVGHGYFLEDGTEIYNLLDRNLGVQAYRGKRLPKQVLPFDPNDGAAFWWANGRKLAHAERRLRERRVRLPLRLSPHGRDAKIVNIKAKNATGDGNKYTEVRPVTGRDAQIAEVGDVEFPELLQPVDDLPPATIITSIVRDGDTLTVRGVSHDNGEITRVTVNGKPAEVSASAVRGGVIDWHVSLLAKGVKEVTGQATDAAGNTEQHAHTRRVE
jgi:hypothetical protein